MTPSGRDARSERAAPSSQPARERWNNRYATAEPSLAPSRFLVDHADLLPRSGTALDVAGGAGRNAIWLARRGLDVTLVDISDTAVALARRAARAAGVDITVARRDVAADGAPDGPWDVIVVVRYLDRALLRAAPRLLRRGGLLLFTQPTVRNLQRHDRPPRQWLLDEGEVSALVGDLEGIELVTVSEAWTAAGRHEAQLVVARRDPKV